MRGTKGYGSTLVLFLVAASGFALGSDHPAAAKKPEAPAASNLEVCERYANRYYREDSPERSISITLSDETFEEDKYEGKVGSQFVSTVLSGEGVWKDKSGEPSTIRYTCLLSNSKTAVYFGVVEDKPRDPVAVCWDGFQPAGWARMTQCLEAALKREEAALGAALKKTHEQAQQSMDKLSAETTLKESNAQWVKYRDTECDRRLAAVMGRNHSDLDELTCKIHKTSERIADLKFDE